jgi:hypothetical protein
MKADFDDIETIRNAVEDEKISLSEWEINYLDSIEERLDSGKELTAPQRKKLAEIMEKVPAW